MLPFIDQRLQHPLPVAKTRHRVDFRLSQALLTSFKALSQHVGYTPTTPSRRAKRLFEWASKLRGKVGRLPESHQSWSFPYSNEKGIRSSDTHQASGQVIDPYIPNVVFRIHKRKLYVSTHVQCSFGLHRGRDIQGDAFDSVAHLVDYFECLGKCWIQHPLLVTHHIP